MKSKKGISQLIATVLIIGFTVVLAAVIISWGSGFIRKTQEDVDVSTEVELACSKLTFDIAKVDCVNGDYGIAPDGGNLSQITIKSNSNQDIAGFTFRGTDFNGNVEVDTSSINNQLGGFDSFGYSWNDNQVSNATLIEAIAHVSVNGGNEACQAAIKKIETINICGFVS